MFIESNLSERDYDTTLYFPHTKITSVIVCEGHNENENQVIVNFSNNTSLMIKRCIIQDNTIQYILDENGNPIDNLQMPTISTNVNEEYYYGTQRKTRAWA